MAIRLKRLHLQVLLFLGMIFSTLQMEKEQFIYHGFHGANISLDGIAVIHPSGLLQLTDTSNHKIGHAFYSFPLKFRENFSFSTCFVVALVPQYPYASAHGLAFTISPSMGFPGAMPSQYLGIFNSSNNENSLNHVFAVELDTLLNPDLNDINGNHVGVDLNGLKSVESAPAAYYTKEYGDVTNFSLYNGEPIQVWVEYDGVEKQLNVTLSPSTVPKPKHPLLSSSIDLSPVIMESMYVGFSAATGGLSCSHYILGWSFKLNGQLQELDLSSLPALPPLGQSQSNPAMRIGFSLAAVALLVAAISVIIYTVRKKKYEELREDWEEEYGPHRFSYKDLSMATKSFSDTQLLGAGGFGKVYRGVIPKSGSQVAVKRVSHESKQGMKEFIAEIVSIGRLRHRNLVQLLGYCRRKGELLLVYDFMSNGSLDKYLFGRGKPILNWDQRYKILKGVASALLYLHEEWEQVVLHRDVKASNVLLDSGLNGRLGDFGLARLYDHGTCAQTSHVVGTLGYLAPELSRTGKAMTSSDVFSFGIVCLEVACGRRPIVLWASPGEMNLVDRVLEFWKRGEILETRDRRLGDEYDVKELELILKLGLLCSHPVPAARPNMRQVMQYLNGDAIFPDITLEVERICAIRAMEEKGLCDSAMANQTSSEVLNNSTNGTESILFVGR